MKTLKTILGLLTVLLWAMSAGLIIMVDLVNSIIILTGHNGNEQMLFTSIVTIPVLIHSVWAWFKPDTVSVIQKLLNGE